MFRVEYEDKYSFLCITSAMDLIKILTAEFQKNENVYQLIENFYTLLESSNWIKKYVFWELELFKLLGFDLELSNLVEEKFVDNQKKYFSKSTSQKKIIPNFLIDKNNETENLSDLFNGLKLVGDYLDKTILKPNNFTQPSSRLQFVNCIK